MFPVAILAGGLATRLRPLTETRPKSLIEVNGEPFIAHQLRLLATQGIPHAILCTGHLGDQVRAFVGDGTGFGVGVRYSDDGAVPLGTGGALRQALRLQSSPLFALYGDSYLTCDFGAVQRAFEASGKAALMTVFENRGAFDQSNVEYGKGQIVAYDKQNATVAMRHIDYGLGVFAPRAFAGYPEGAPLDLARVYQDLLAAGELAAFEVRDRFYEIGSAAGVRDLSDYLAAAARS